MLNCWQLMQVDAAADVSLQGASYNVILPATKALLSGMWSRPINTILVSCGHVEEPAWQQ